MLAFSIQMNAEKHQKYLSGLTSFLYRFNARFVKDIVNYQVLFERTKSIAIFLLLVQYLQFISMHMKALVQSMKLNIGPLIYFFRIVLWRNLLIESFKDIDIDLVLNSFLLSIYVWFFLSKLLFYLGIEHRFNNVLTVVFLKTFPFFTFLIVCEEAPDIVFNKNSTNITISITTVNFILAILTNFVYLIFNNNNLMNSKDYLGRSSTVHDIILSVLFPFVGAHFLYDPITYNILFVLVCIIIILRQIKSSTNRLYFSFSISILLLSILSLPRQFIVKQLVVVSSIQIFLIYSLAVAFIKFSMNFKDNKQIEILKQNFKHFNNPEYQDSQFLKEFYQAVSQHLSNCDIPNCPCFKRPLDSLNIFKIKLLQDAQKLLYQQPIRLAQFQFELKNKPINGISKLLIYKSSQELSFQNLALIDMNLAQGKIKFGILVKQNKLKNQFLHMAQALYYFEIVQNLQVLVVKVIKNLIYLYSILCDDIIEIRQLEQANQYINTLKAKIDDKVLIGIKDYSDGAQFNKLLKFYYTYIQIYKSRIVELDAAKSVKAIQKNIQRNDQNTSLYEQNYALIMIDMLQKLGSIININVVLEKSFGYQNKEIIGFNVKILMPNIFSAYHDQFLKNFIKYGELRLLKSADRNLYGKSKHGLIMHINVRVKLYLTDGEFRAAGMIKELSRDNMTLLVQNRGRILDCNQVAFQFFSNYLPLNRVKLQRFQLYKLIPMLMVVGQQHDMQEITNSTLALPMMSQASKTFLHVSRLFDKTLLKRLQNTEIILNSTMTDTTLDSSRNVSNNSIMDIDINFTMNFKHFIKTINLFHLQGYKAFYSVGNIVTSAFTIKFVEIKSLSKLSHREFFKSILEEFQKLTDVLDIDLKSKQKLKIERYQQMLDEVSQGHWDKYLQVQKQKGLQQLILQAKKFKRKSEPIKLTNHSLVVKDLNSIDERQIVDDQIQLLKQDNVEMILSQNSGQSFKKQMLIEAFENKHDERLRRKLYVTILVLALLYLTLGMALNITVFLNNASDLNALNFYSSYNRLFQNVNSAMAYHQQKRYPEMQSLLLKDSSNCLTKMLTQSQQLLLQNFRNNDHSFPELYLNFNLSILLTFKSILNKLQNNLDIKINYTQFNKHAKDMAQQISNFIVNSRSVHINTIYTINALQGLLILMLILLIIPVYLWSQDSKKSLLELISYFKRESVINQMQFFQNLIILNQKDSEGVHNQIDKVLILLQEKYNKFSNPTQGIQFTKKQRSVIGKTKSKYQFLAVISLLLMTLCCYPAFSAFKSNSYFNEQYKELLCYSKFNLAMLAPSQVFNNIFFDSRVQVSESRISDFVEAVYAQSLQREVWVKIVEQKLNQSNQAFINSVTLFSMKMNFIIGDQDNNMSHIMKIIDLKRLKDYSLLDQARGLSKQAKVNELQTAFWLLLVLAGTIWVVIGSSLYKHIRTSLGQAQNLYSNLSDSLIYQNSYIVSYLNNKISK